MLNFSCYSDGTDSPNAFQPMVHLLYYSFSGTSPDLQVWLSFSCNL